MLHASEQFQMEMARGPDVVDRVTREAVTITESDCRLWLEHVEENSLFTKAESIGRDLYRLFGDEVGYDLFATAAAILGLREDYGDTYLLGCWSTYARDWRAGDKIIIDLMDDSYVQGWAAPAGIAAGIERLRDIAMSQRTFEEFEREERFTADLDARRAARAAEIDEAKRDEAAIEKRQRDAVWNDSLTEAEVEAAAGRYEAEVAAWRKRYGEKLWPHVYAKNVSAEEAMRPNMSIVPTHPTPDYVQSSAEFVRDFVPPEYLLDGVLQRRFCYSITAATGTGKTALAMLLSGHVCVGRSLGGVEVAKGPVLYFAGENPVDIQMRWLGLTQEMGINPESADVHFIAGVYPLSQVATAISAEVARKAILPALVVVDTAAAYNEGDNENDNAQAVAHARRLRSLTDLPGGPCVVILCHPTKRAGDDDLLPRGGGAFIAEVDGNIAVRKHDRVISASAFGKFRGREFAPLNFELKTVFHPTLKDARGRDIPTVVAHAVSETDSAQMAASARRHEDVILKSIETHPKISGRERANALGWVYSDGKPDQSKVQRAVKTLEKDGLIRGNRGKWELTSKGEKELNRIERDTSEAGRASILSISPPLPRR